MDTLFLEHLDKLTVKTAENIQRSEITLKICGQVYKHTMLRPD